MPFPIDPRLLQRLGVPGPVGPVQMTPGFKPPGPAPAPGAQVMQVPPMSVGVPGFGMGGPRGPVGPQQPSANGGMPAAEEEGLRRGVAGIQALQPGPDGQFAPPPMPTNIGSGQGGGGFMDWLKRQTSGLF